MQVRMSSVLIYKKLDVPFQTLVSCEYKYLAWACAYAYCALQLGDQKCSLFVAALYANYN